MLIYGWNNKELKQQQRPNIQCHNCNKIGYVNVSKIVKYWHLYWIPMFPYGMTNIFECTQCLIVQDFKEMSDEVKRMYVSEKNTKPPIWSFAGIIIIGLVIIYSAISSIPDTEGMIAKIKEGEINRIFDFKTVDGEYSSFKICDADRDYLYIVYNQYQSSRRSEMDDVSAPMYFDKDTMAVEREVLIDEIENGTIVEVHW